MMYYHIDLTARKPTISEYFGETLKNDLKRENLKNPLDLSSYEFKVFKTLDSAVKYYNLYYDTLETLDNAKICKSRELKSLRLMRFYIVQVVLNQKTFSYQKTKKDWKIGQLFNFHDQTFFVTCKLISIEKTDNANFPYLYKFKRA